MISDWPILFFENYFASDSQDPNKAPTYPYDGREKTFFNNIDIFVLNTNCNYKWQFGAMHTAFDFLNNPLYNPQKSFEDIISILGGNPNNTSKEEFLKMGERYWESIKDNYK